MQVEINKNVRQIDISNMVDLVEEMSAKERFETPGVVIYSGFHLDYGYIHVVSCVSGESILITPVGSQS